MQFRGEGRYAVRQSRPWTEEDVRRNAVEDHPTFDRRNFAPSRPLPDSLGGIGAIHAGNENHVGIPHNDLLRVNIGVFLFHLMGDVDAPRPRDHIVNKRAFARCHQGMIADFDEHAGTRFEGPVGAPAGGRL